MPPPYAGSPYRAPAGLRRSITKCRDARHNATEGSPPIAVGITPRIAWGQTAQQCAEEVAACHRHCCVMRRLDGARRLSEPHVVRPRAGWYYFCGRRRQREVTCRPRRSLPRPRPSQLSRVRGRHLVPPRLAGSPCPSRREGRSSRATGTASGRRKARAGGRHAACRHAERSYLSACPARRLGDGRHERLRAAVSEQLSALGLDVDVYTRRQDPTVPTVVPFAEGARVIHIDAGPAVPLPKDAILDYLPEFVAGVRRPGAARWRALRSDARALLGVGRGGSAPAAALADPRGGHVPHAGAHEEPRASFGAGTRERAARGERTAHHAPGRPHRGRHRRRPPPNARPLPPAARQDLGRARAGWTWSGSVRTSKRPRGARWAYAAAKCSCSLAASSG